MELITLHCERSGCISHFHALMEEENHKTEAEFHSLVETPHAEAVKNRSCFIQPSGNVASIERVELRQSKSGADGSH